MNELEEMKPCKCEICGILYRKPIAFVEPAKKRPYSFFARCLRYCDDCRSKRERRALENIHIVIEAIEAIDENQIEKQ